MLKVMLRLGATLFACLVALAAANVALAVERTKDQPHDTSGAAVAAAPAADAQADPGNLTGFRDQVGATLLFTVTGTTNGGSVYGDGVYTDDSPIAVAAVHAGVVGVGETKDLTVEILPGQNSYKASFAFGVHTSSYGAWQGSYKFLDTPMSETEAVFPEPGNVNDYQSRIGKTFHFQITGSTDASIWGDGIYTTDSDLDTAAVHAGVLQDGEDGVVAVKILPGQGKYNGRSRNGVESQSYGSFGGSFEFVDQDGKPIKPSGK